MSGIDNFINKNNTQQYYLNQKAEQNSAAINPSEEVKSDIKTAEDAKIEEVKTVNNNVQTETLSAANAQIRDEFVREKKNNGLVGKFYNFLKNKTGAGLGSKKVEKEIDKFEKGEISEEQVREKISQYKVSRENAVQQTGDLAAIGTVGSMYYLINDQIKKLRARFEIGAEPEVFRNLKEYDKTFLGKNANKIKQIIMSKGKTTAYLLPILALIGGMTKLQTLQLERITSKEYKTDKKLSKKERKIQKKLNRIAKREQDMKNFATGAVAGLLTPISALVGGIVGVPAFLAATTGLRYITGKNDENKKSFSDFTKVLKDNAAVNTVAAALIAVPAFKHAHYSKILGENLDKVVKKLKGKQLHFPDLPSQKTAYEELEEKLVESPAIKNILEGHSGLNGSKRMDAIIKDLSEENIFAVKFLQIRNNGFLEGKSNPYSEISEALREDCPPTRTLEQAKTKIAELLGNSDYTVSKLLGVGTVAETYLAKDKSGKEVCIKILKEGITTDKINADKEKFIQLITEGKPIESLSEDQKYLLRNIDDLANGILNEVNFKVEMEAAQKLVKHCKKANVVKPIEAKEGIYIMEKAPGISLKTLSDYYNAEMDLKWYKKLSTEHPSEYIERKITEIQARIEKIKSRAPEFDLGELNPKQIKRLLNEYINVQVEQFSKLDKNGKVIHADIHPGNIFINLENLKSGKGKLFTLIDTGNTITMTKEQTKAALRIIPFIKNGNYKELSKIVLDGAVLPQGMTKADALSKVETDLKTFFFDTETKIPRMNIDSFYAISDNILRKYSIIPNNTQLNLNKAKISAKNSFNDLTKSFFSKKYGDKDMDDASMIENAGTFTSLLKDAAALGAKLVTAQQWQETKNLFQMSFKEAWQHLRNPNKLKTNSEDYLTFEMKQYMPGPNDVRRVAEEEKI